PPSVGHSPPRAPRPRTRPIAIATCCATLGSTARLSDRMGPAMDDTTPRDDAPAHPHALPNRTVIAGYRIEGVLGAGGFGITYKAFNPITRHTVAIKEFFPAAIAASRGDGGRLVYSASDSKLVAWSTMRLD